MTDRLSDERLCEVRNFLVSNGRVAESNGWAGMRNDFDNAAHAIDELLELRAEVKACAGSLDDTIALLQEQNTYLRERCTWLQERLAVLRKLLAAKWSKRKEVRAMRAKLAERDHTFDLRWKATQRAIKRWQEANPGNDLVWPDHADLCVWLMEQLAAGPVMPEVPSDLVLSAISIEKERGAGRPINFYNAIRSARLREQSR